MKMNRRSLIKGLGSFAAAQPFRPLNALISGLAVAQTLRSRAAAGPASVANYIYIYAFAGVARWGFDLAINPYAEGAPGTYVQNPGLNNCFSPNASGALLPAYAGKPITVAGQTLSMPPLWQCSLPRPDGSTVPMANLMANMITMRGINMEADGHPNNAIRQFLPVPGAGSLNGLVADASSTPIPAIDLTTEPYLNAAYQSLRGIGLGTWFPSQTANNPMQQLLAAFVSDPTLATNSAYLTRMQVDSAVENALSAMQAAAQTQNSNASALYSDRLSARGLLKQSFTNLGPAYSALLAKYQNLISQCAGRTDIVGINDQPLPTSVMPSQYCNTDSGTINTSDLRAVIATTSTVSLLAEGCATTEYMLTSGLSTASMITAGPSTGLNLLTAAGSTPFTHNPDEHIVGTAASVIITSFYFRSLATCLYELINVLQTNGLFNNTVIQIGSEFSRAPRIDGSGADHNSEGSVTSVLSGMINSPCIVGDCFANSSTLYAANPVYIGSFGASAPMTIAGSTTSLNIGHVTSTVADMLGVARPAGNFPPVFDVTSTGVTPNVEKARNV